MVRLEREWTAPRSDVVLQHRCARCPSSGLFRGAVSLAQCQFPHPAYRPTSVGDERKFAALRPRRPRHDDARGRTRASTFRKPVSGATAPAAIAAETVAPFDLKTCPRPFHDAQVIQRFRPSLDIAEGQFAGGPAEALGVIAIDENGKLVDTWLFASSGNAALDDAVMQLAKKTTYEPAVAYCRHVQGLYLVGAGV